MATPVRKHASDTRHSQRLRDDKSEVEDKEQGSEDDVEDSNEEND